MVGLTFSTLQVMPSAPDICNVDLDAFTTHGCEIHHTDGNADILKSPIGPIDFCKEFCMKQARGQVTVLEFLAELDDPHVAQYLMQWSVNASRLNYMARTTPRDACKEAAMYVDSAILATAATVVGQRWSERQSCQASFGTGHGGLGFYQIAEALDVAYLSSHAATHDLCIAIRPEHTWDCQQLGTPLAAAHGRLCSLVADAGILDGQRRLNKAVSAESMRTWLEGASPPERVRYNANAARGAGKLFELVPSKTLDAHMKASKYATNAERLLGVDFMEGGRPCNLCGVLLDSWGTHPQSCTSGGKQSVEHNAVRNVVYDYCERALLRPDRESPVLLKNDLDPHTQERPADVLVLPSLAFCAAIA